MDEDEVEALAAEIADAEHLNYAQARDAAAVDLATLRAYAAEWNAERRAQWHALRAFERRWNLNAAVRRAFREVCGE